MCRNKYDCLHGVIWSMSMTMRLKIKNRSYRYNINIPRSRHGHKYANYKISHYNNGYVYWATPKQYSKLNSWKS